MVQCVAAGHEIVAVAHLRPAGHAEQEIGRPSARKHLRIFLISLTDTLRAATLTQIILIESQDKFSSGSSQIQKSFFNITGTWCRYQRVHFFGSQLNI